MAMAYDLTGAQPEPVDPTADEAEARDSYPRVDDLLPGERVEIYGGVPVTLLEVGRVGDLEWMRLLYQWGTDAHGQPMLGTWVLPASQRLPLLP